MPAFDTKDTGTVLQSIFCRGEQHTDYAETHSIVSVLDGKKKDISK